LLCGPFPRTKNVRDILDTGVTTFVCLVEKHELDQHGPNFIEVAQSKTKNVQLNFLHYPIRDRDIGPDDGVTKLALEIISLLNQGETIYIHCVGGHGRTGVMVSLILAKLFSLDSFTALEYCKKFHDMRTVTLGRDSPQTTEQRNQVHRLVPKLLAM
jgi:protein-tyrosine phosphatase